MASVSSATVVTITYNSRAVIERLVASLQQPGLSMLMVDNGSMDGCQAWAASQPDIRVIQCRNIGYGRAANIGLEEVRTPYALLVNPDVVAAPGMLEAMLACMEQHPDIGILGANVNGTAGEGIFDVEWIVGALMLIRMEALRTVGMFDPSIFLFYEETDLCLRFRKAGYRLARLESAVAVHDAGTSTPASLRLVQVKAWHAAWSRCYYYRKHFSWLVYLRKTSGKTIYALARMLRGVWLCSPEQIYKNIYELIGICAFIGGRSAFVDGVGRGMEKRA